MTTSPLADLRTLPCFDLSTFYHDRPRNPSFRPTIILRKILATLNENDIQRQSFRDNILLINFLGVANVCSMADSIDERSIRTDRRISRVLSPGHRKLNGEISSSYAARLECHSIFCRFLIYSRLLSLTASSYSGYAAVRRKKREKKKREKVRWVS